MSGVQNAAKIEHADDDMLMTPLSFGDLREEERDDEFYRGLKADRRTGAWSVQDDFPLRPRKLEREMLFALSRRDFHQVSELYRSSLSSGGLPASFRTLELAVQASLQESPGIMEGAKKLLAEADAAGMNTAAARGPLLLMEMNTFSPEDKKNAKRLTWKVLEYHRANENSGLRIGAIVGVHAANILINNRCAQEGLRILRALHTPGNALYRPDDSIYAATNPTFNIVTLTVFIKAFVSLGQADGIRWAVAYILQHNIRVDIAILDSLRNHVKKLSEQHQYDRTALPPRTRLALAKYLREARLLLSARRSQQQLESARFGKKLLRCLRSWRYATLNRDAILKRDAMLRRDAMLNSDGVRTHLFEPDAEEHDRVEITMPRAVSSSRNRRIRREGSHSISLPLPTMTAGHKHDDGELQHDALSHVMSTVAASG
jgi:hypothetical protein